jgi:predicted O-linked N-acetylglucosamine transferase (SPINDLY family)
VGFTDLVAADKADFIGKVLHLGTDADFRHAMRRELAARVPMIYKRVSKGQSLTS